MQLWEPKMCCCFKLRTGNLIIGILYLVYGCLSVLGAVNSLITGKTDEIREFCREFSTEVEVSNQDCIITARKFVIGSSVVSLLVSSFYIAFSSMLIHGIMKQKTRFFVPLMVMYLIQICILILIALTIIGVLVYAGVGVVFNFIFAIIFGLIIFLETYFLLVIRAYYFEIKRTKGQVHMSLHEQNVEVPPYVDHHQRYPN